jgi:hypothetical protein
MAIEGKSALTALTRGDAEASLHTTYQRWGCCRLGQCILPLTLLERARSVAAALARGEFAPGRAPWRVLHGSRPGSLIKIDQPHSVDPVLFELVTHPALGAFAAELSGARRIQAWATQLLIKPSRGGRAGCVGWHTDQQYWPWFRGGVFTLWIALEDVLPESGPVRLLAGSHRWPEGTFTGDAFGQDLGAQENAWRARLGEAEREALSLMDLTLPAGGVALFDGNLLHCSGPNTTGRARTGLALHLCSERTEKFPRFDDYGFVKRLDCRDECPVIFGAA